MGAQRLSASSEFTRDRVPGRCRDLNVLNAFRHHRNSHLHVGAQARRWTNVLNAFRHHRNSHTSSRCAKLAPICAQRLSASSEFTRCEDPYPCHKSEVLNAFRHHRNSHDAICVAAFVEPIVLNAFRHHRNSHNTRCRFDSLAVLCSTPFGIIGIHTVS